MENIIDFMSIPAPSTASETRTFIDARFPDKPVTLHFKSPDLVDISNISDMTESFISKYQALPFPLVQGRHVVIGRTLAQQVATIFCLQCGDVRYSMEQITIMAVTMPTVFNDISNYLAQLNAESELGKLMGGRLQHEHSYVTTDGTPSSMSE